MTPLGHNKGAGQRNAPDTLAKETLPWFIHLGEHRPEELIQQYAGLAKEKIFSQHFYTFLSCLYLRL